MPASPGILLRLTALGGAVASGAVVASAAFELGRVHWAAALVALPLLVAVAIAGVMSYRLLRVPAIVAASGMAAAFATGGLVAWLDGSRATVGVHIGVAAVAFASSLVTLAVALRGRPEHPGSLADLIALTKPRVMSLLLVTGAGGMFVGAGGMPDPVDLVVMIVGLALACGGAGAFNHVLDADIDRLMGDRTAARPVAAGRLSAPYALEFALVLSAMSFALLASAANVLTALLALAGNLFYVVVYTRYLKRSTDWNIVIGGAAGAVPPLVGYAAATGDLGVPAVALFLIVFLWTPPHFWALALMIKGHYAAARVPMLPGTRGDAETTRQILWYSVATVATTVVVGIWLGPIYTGAAVALGAWFLVLARRLRREAARGPAVALFHYSLLYLALLFVAAAVDPIVLS